MQSCGSFERSGIEISKRVLPPMTGVKEDGSLIKLREDRLEFRFPEVHTDAKCRIEFQRTLRISDNNRHYPLPPRLGRFPLNHVDGYADTVPKVWDEYGGVFLPMLQSKGPASILGLAPGGLMRQEIYETPMSSRCGLRLYARAASCISSNGLQFFAVTCAEFLNVPPIAEECTNAGLPWFEYYAGDRGALHGATQLADLDSVTVARKKRGKGDLAGNRPVLSKLVEKIGTTQAI